MLRITVEQANAPAVLKLEGKLSGPWVSEAGLIWKRLTGDQPGKKIRVDLSGVTFVDSKGKQLLKKMLTGQADVRDPPLFMRFIMDEMKAAGIR
ncbi:MAG: hypothetical protein ACRD1I_01195 [Terriglobia bacterium]